MRILEIFINEFRCSFFNLVSGEKNWNFEIISDKIDNFIFYDESDFFIG